MFVFVQVFARCLRCFSRVLRFSSSFWWFSGVFRGGFLGGSTGFLVLGVLFGLLFFWWGAFLARFHALF